MYVNGLLYSNNQHVVLEFMFMVALMEPRKRGAISP